MWRRKLDYASSKAPRWYCCSSCGGRDRKLWRQTQTCASAIDLLCAPCAMRDQKLDGEWAPSEDSPDQIYGSESGKGGLVPAVPTEDGKTYWGYTSVSGAGVSWWWRLPPHSRDVPVEPDPPPLTCPVKDEEVEYLVEATSAEKLDIWRRYHRAVQWKEVGIGVMETVGHIRVGGKKMPVCVSVFFDRVDGHTIAFYHATSQVVDHRMVERWLDAIYVNSKGKVDSMNFHNCLDALGVKADVKICDNCRAMY